MSNTLCPGCEEQVLENIFEDAASRPWHHECALRALANGFRTPLSPEDATRTVSFESDEETWIAPHSFHLREIILCDDVELSGVYLGSQAMVYALQVPIYARDLPERRLVIDHDFPLGVHLWMQGVPRAFRYKLIGERRPESASPRPGSKCTLAVASLRTEVPVAPKETVDTMFFMAANFRGERVVCSDWQDWEVVDVRLGVDPGRSTQGQSTRLTGYSTDIPIYQARVAEVVTYRMRNLADHPRNLTARVYGTLVWWESVEEKV